VIFLKSLNLQHQTSTELTFEMFYLTSLKEQQRVIFLKSLNLRLQTSTELTFETFEAFETFEIYLRSLTEADFHQISQNQCYSHIYVVNLIAS